MTGKRIKKEVNNEKTKDSIKKKTQFNLAEVIIIMVITAVCAITITIKVSFTANKNKSPFSQS